MYIGLRQFGAKELGQTDKVWLKIISINILFAVDFTLVVIIISLISPILYVIFIQT